jgi:hypothetical protein
MANFKSDIVTAKDSLALSDAQHSSGELTLTVPVVVTLKTAMAADDTIQLADLPAGAILVPQLSKATCVANPGTSLVVDIGDAADDDRYADGLTLTTAGEDVFFTDDSIPAAVATPYRPSEGTRIFATVKTATSITDDATLLITLVYRIRG